MTTAAEIRPLVQTLIRPVCEEMSNLMGPNFATREAVIMLTAIGLQESRLAERAQIVVKANGVNGKGPARGLWQFEKGSVESRGGVTGVFMHQGVARLSNLETAMQHFGLDPSWTPARIWAELETNDRAACFVARLLLYTDPARLTLNADEMWSVYLRTWRPGKPHRETWDRLFAIAINAHAPVATTATKTAKTSVVGILTGGTAVVAGAAPMVAQGTQIVRDVQSVLPNNAAALGFMLLGLIVMVFALARQIGEAALKPSRFLTPALYPELARLAAARDRDALRRLLLHHQIAGRLRQQKN